MTSQELLAVAHAIGAEMDRQTYTHYRPHHPEELGSVLVDGDLDLLRVAAVAVEAYLKGALAAKGGSK